MDEDGGDWGDVECVGVVCGEGYEGCIEGGDCERGGCGW